MSPRVALLGVGLALVFPAQALATKCAPPGTSGVNQYIETIPGGKCSQQPPQGRIDHRSGGALPPGAESALTSEGPAGVQVARLVLATGTAPRRRPRGRSAGGSAGGSRLALVSGRSWQSGLLHPAFGSSSGGLGSLLPILFGLILLVTLLAAAFRRASRRP